MEHLFVIDAPARLDPAGDSSIALMREAAGRGGAVDVCEVADLSIEGVAQADASAIEIRDGADWYELGERRRRDLGAYDVVWMRKDPPFDADYLHATLLLSHAAGSTLVVNSAESLRDANEKLFALRFPELCPETIVSKRLDRLLEFTRGVGRAVIKPLDFSGGEGVELVGPESAERLEEATRNETRFLQAQRFLPEVDRGDKRIILVDGEPRGAVLRLPPEGEFRANLHLGGKAQKTTLSEKDREICEAIGPELRRRGVVFAGIDVIGDYLTEINVTSPTGLRQITALEGLRLEVDILDAVERRVIQSAPRDSADLAQR